MKKKRAKSVNRTYKGLPMIDATKDLQINVLKTDVSRARKNDPAKCAASLATQRELKTEVEVHIARTYVKVGAKGKQKWLRFLTPNSISREITSFDRGAAFEPGQYILKAPTVSQQLGQHRGASTTPETGKRRQNPAHVTANIRESAR